MDRSSSSPRRWVAALAIIIASASSPARAGYTITPLGPGSAGSSDATGINANGAAAGSATLSQGPMTAARWGAPALGAVAVPAGAVTSMATAINASGVVAGTYTDGNNLTHAFFSGPNGATALPALSVGGMTGTYTTASGINDSGTVVGTGNIPSPSSPSGVSRAFTSSGGSETVIAPLASGTYNQGGGINKYGTVVGSSEIAPGGLVHAFYTGPTGVAVDLMQPGKVGDFFGNTYGTAIANDGDIVGYGDVGGSQHAFYAPSVGTLAAPSYGTLVDLGTLGNATSSMANAVNDLGMVVGVSGNRAFLWTASGGMVDLNGLLSASDQKDWVLTSATGINGAGQVCGQGYFDGTLEGFVLTPNTVPEPPTALLAAIGLATVAAGSRARLRLGRTSGRAGA